MPEVVSAVEAQLPVEQRAISTRESSLPATEGLLTKDKVIQALIEFRDGVIRTDMPDWEAHRSILRDAMIETFVSQVFTDPDQWFAKVPTFLRQSTNPIEKKNYLERICEIVGRLDSATRLQTPSLLSSSAKPATPPLPETVSGPRYVIAEFSTVEFSPDASRFYDSDYRTVLGQMIALVIKMEAPIYEDILVDRIARAHGFKRSGNNIYQTITRLIGREFMKSKDADRVVIWPGGLQANTLSPYRESSHGVRSHADIPIAELASLGAPFIRLRMSDEEVLRRMADHFKLGRLREATRDRFRKALELARHALQ